MIRDFSQCLFKLQSRQQEDNCLKTDRHLSHRYIPGGNPKLINVSFMKPKNISERSRFVYKF